MTTAQWIAVALGLMGVFLLSAALGGLVARQLNATAPPAVSVASPTPHASIAPTVGATPSRTAASLPPTPNATPSPLPVLTPSPVPTVEPTPPVTLDPATVEEFTTDLATALGDGDSAYLIAHLHPATTERFGDESCRRYVRGIPHADPKWEILSSSGPAPWTYTTDGMDTVIPDAWTVSVRQPGADPELRDLHFAPSDGTWRWFTDCGDPR